MLHRERSHEVDSASSELLAETCLAVAVGASSSSSSSQNTLSSLVSDDDAPSSSSSLTCSFRFFSNAFMPLPWRESLLRFLAFLFPLGNSSPWEWCSCFFPPLLLSFSSDSSSSAASSFRFFFPELVWNNKHKRRLLHAEDDSKKSVSLSQIPWGHDQPDEPIHAYSSGNQEQPVNGLNMHIALHCVFSSEASAARKETTTD